MNKIQKLRSAGLGLAILISGTAAHAAIDVTAVTTKIGEGEAAAVSLGGAALIVIAVIGLFTWLRRPVK